MLKPINIITGAATGMLAAAALTACSDTDAPSLAEQEVWMTIDVSRRGADTDSRLTHAEGTPGLDANWEPGDYIYVFDNSGSRYLGRIDWQQEVTNTATENVATFAGKLTDVNDGEGQTFVLYYVGKDSKGTRRTLTTDHGISIDMSSQAGSFESMAWNDIMSAGPMVDVADGVVTPRAAAINMGHLNSFAHFATNLPADTRVTISTTNGLTPEFNIISGTGYRFNLTPAAVTATVQADGHLYVTLPNPGRISNQAITFTASNGATATLKAAALSAGNYYRAGWSADGGSEGITLEFTGGETPDYPGYENEDPRNPLHKFAKFNLTRTGDGEVTNRFVDSETENGALYQWGRNYGFEDIPHNHSSMESLTDFINWEDAFGELTSEGNQRYWDFYTYSASGATYYTLTGGIRIGYIYMNFDEAKTYNSISDLQAHPTKYFMDARYNNGEYVGNLGGYLFSTCNPDYWVWSGGGNSWTERATACGYDNSNPCPEGWRMPTKADFEAIAPYETAIKDKQNLSTLLREWTPELRVTSDGIKYVVKWIYRNTYLEVKAIVVDNNFTKSQISDIIWENNPDIVTRNFPFTGGIRACGGYDGLERVDVAFPYHMGVPDWGYLDYGSVGCSGNVNDGMAGYWMEDKGYVFRFTASERTGAETSYLEIETASPVMGYAIRPVMDIP